MKHHYDKDLYRFRLCALLLIVLNAGTGFGFALRHDWYYAGAFVVWCINLVAILSSVRRQQRTRDEARIVSAAIRAHTGRQ
jgi:hypothetical protein